MNMVYVALEKIQGLAEVHDCKALINDIREAESGLSVTDLYYLPQRSVKGAFNHSWRRAILVKNVFDEAAFYEDTASNQGLDTKVVTSVSEALDWVHSTKQS